MYIKIKDRKLFKGLDEHLTLPKKFNYFVNKIYATNNFIIKEKGKKTYYCTNCKYSYTSNKLKINTVSKCPQCSTNLIVKSSRLQNYTFEKDFAVLDEYLDNWVLRYFHVKGDFKNGTIKNHVCEYARQIIKKDSFFEKLTIINNHISSYISGWYFNYSIDTLNWRYYNKYGFFHINSAVKLYPYNLKKIFKNTKYEYSQLWKLANKTENMEIIYMMKYYNPSVELLIKLKLWSLAQNPQTFKKAGSFMERFGVPRSYLSFMQKHNITLSELNVLKYTKEMDIEVLRMFAGINIADYKNYNIDLKRLINSTDYTKEHHKEYVDYLSFAKELGYDITDKKILYPKNIIDEHDKLVNLIKIKKNKEIENNIKNRYEELKNNIFKTKKYIIFPAKSIKEFIEESRQQNNCVKTYMEKYAKKHCDIYFMRLNSTPKKSLVTIEVNNNKVVQQRTKNNMDTTKEQKSTIKLFEKRLKNQREKIKNEIKMYNNIRQ